LERYSGINYKASSLTVNFSSWMKSLRNLDLTFIIETHV
jgi:hypothetical protein